MIEIKLIHNKGLEWVKHGMIWVKSCVYQTNKLISLIEEEGIFKTAINNNFFSMIIENEDKIYLVADRIRSIPIYYCCYNNNIYISDEAYWIKETIQNTKIDKNKKMEFLSTGYVTGDNTLYAEIKQVQAGEIIEICTQKINIKSYTYFDFKQEKLKNSNTDDLLQELQRVHKQVFKRLIKSLSDRHVILPLSGGYDSRLIAFMLKELGYEKVICFTYGKKNNKESEISKKIASHLGYKWYFIEYTEEKWKKCMVSEEYKSYSKYASNLSSIQHIQDFIAVKELKEKINIPSDAIFIPGHSYDFLAGSHIPQHYLENVTIAKEQVIKDIIKKHFILTGNKALENEFYSYITKQIDRQIETEQVLLDNITAIDVFEWWDWKERQAKFIVNSIRVYEFFGYEWRIPLWDNQLIAYWTTIPHELRNKRKLFFMYVTKQNMNLLNKENVKRRDIVKVKLKNGIKNILNSNNITFYYIIEFFQDNMSWFSTYRYIDKIKYILSRKKGINSQLVEDYFENFDL